MDSSRAIRSCSFVDRRIGVNCASAGTLSLSLDQTHRITTRSGEALVFFFALGFAFPYMMQVVLSVSRHNMLSSQKRACPEVPELMLFSVLGPAAVYVLAAVFRRFANQFSVGDGISLLLRIPLQASTYIWIWCRRLGFHGRTITQSAGS